MKQLNQTAALILIAFSSALMGVSMILMGHHRSIDLITNFYGITHFASDDLFNSLAALSFVLISVLSLGAIKFSKLQRPVGWTMIAVGIFPLLSLVSETMYLSKLGGFPAIGSGQGIIKYFALLSVGLLIIFPNLTRNTKIWISLFPVILVLLWIGGMKFTLFEAQGIETLVKSSPLMAWMYDVWDLQTTSNLIGLYDLIAILLLVAAVFYTKLLVPSVLMSGAVFVVTQTFLFSWDSALSTDTLLSGGGHFLIKDLWFIANLLFFITLVKSENEHQTADNT